MAMNPELRARMEEEYPPIGIEDADQAVGEFSGMAPWQEMYAEQSVMALPRQEMEGVISPRFIGNLYRAELRFGWSGQRQNPSEREIDLMWLDGVMRERAPYVIAVYLPALGVVCYVPLAPMMVRKLIRWAWHAEEQRCPSVVGWTADGERRSLNGLPLARTLNRLVGRSYGTLSECAAAIETGLIAPESGMGWLTFGGPAGGGIVELLEMEHYS